jgi:predicted DNA-binding transcriptional regulator AlpA
MDVCAMRVKPKFKLQPDSRKRINIAVVASILDCHTYTVMRRVKADKRFPQPVRLPGSRRLQWFEDEVQAFAAGISRAYA